MTSNAACLELQLLGPTSQSQLRAFLDAFENRGWRDPGSTALELVRALESREGGKASWRTLARLVPSEFLARNDVKRRELEEFFQDLICSSARRAARR